MTNGARLGRTALAGGAAAPGVRATALLLPLLAGACVHAGALEREAAATPGFDPLAFFAGRTHGEGKLHIMLHRAEPVAVQGVGRLRHDGALVLDQRVRRGNRPETTRQWVLRRAAPGRYTGTLSDATGPVTGVVDGNRLTLRFRMKGGLGARQWLYLRPDGVTVRNRMVLTKFGLPVASLDETIRAEDPAH